MTNSDSRLESGFQMLDMKWSPAEKIVARRAFDRALKSELEEIIQETKRRAAKIAQPADLWELEGYLTERRKEIDRKYDYRYSVLPMVFIILVHQGRLTEKDLHGLSQDKLDHIRRGAKL